MLIAALLSGASAQAQTVTALVAGNSYSLFLKGGNLWGMGANGQGDMGDGTNILVLRPTQLGVSNVTAIAAGEYHSLLIKSDGSLWAMGWNISGQLGAGPSGLETNGDIYNSYFTNRPEQIVGSGVKAIAAGLFHSLFLMDDGSLWAMGGNSNGQLGDGAGQPSVTRPEQILASGVTAIAAGGYHSLFLKTDGSLWAMGDDSAGQLGDGANVPSIRPEQIEGGGVVAIAAGNYHSLFLKDDGSLWAMGFNKFGQLGDGTSNDTNRPEQIVASGVTAIAAGLHYSMFLKSDGSLWGTGDNSSGQLGDGTAGYNNSTNNPEMIVASGVTKVAAGYHHCVFLKNDGSLWAMGDNQAGEMGDGTYITSWETNYPWAVTRPQLILPGPNAPPGYGLIVGQLLASGDMRLSFVGVVGANYALDRSVSVAPLNWLPQATNSTDAGGMLVFTNTPTPTANNFWRVRPVR